MNVRLVGVTSELVRLVNCTMIEVDDDIIAKHVAHVLRHVWNPIRLGVEGPEDEYDSYVADLLPLVQNRRSFEGAIVAHLLRIETERMCLTAAPIRARRTARALLGLREAAERAPDQLMMQTISADGLRCLWIYRRPDGLYTYEHACLRQEIDDNGEVSFWVAAGDVRPGLYSTSEAAQRDALIMIDWPG